MNTLALHIIDIIQNSISAGARLITLSICEQPDHDMLTVTIEDNGRGLHSEEVAKLSDPFFTSRTTRRVGMGIPLFMQTAEQTGGKLTIDSTPGRGTKVEASFHTSHLDMPPMGDIANVYALTVGTNPDIDFTLNYIYRDKAYLIDTVEIKEILEDVPINSPQTIKAIEEMIGYNINSLKTII